MVTKKEVAVATPEKYVELPYSVFLEMEELLPEKRALEVGNLIRIFTKVVVRKEERTVSSGEKRERETFGQDVYKPGKGAGRKDGSLGRFG